MNWEAWKPLATLIFTSTLKFVGGLLVAHGLATNGPGLEALGGAATTAAGAFWSWWVQKGHIQAADYLKKLTDTATTAAAVAVAKKMAPAAATGAAADAHLEVKEDTGVTVPKAPIIMFAAAIVLSAFLAGGAQAQTVRKPQVTGDIVADTKANFGTQQSTAVGAPAPVIKPQELMQKIVALAAPDLTYAVALANKANTNASTVRLGCLKAIQALNAQVSGTGLTGPDGNPLSMPDTPHIFTDLEQAAEGIDALSPTGPLFTSCAGAAALAGMNVLAFINAMVAGTAAAAIVVPK